MTTSTSPRRCHCAVKLAQGFGAPCGLWRGVTAPVTLRANEEQSSGGQVNTAEGTMLVHLVAWATFTAECRHPSTCGSAAASAATTQPRPTNLPPPHHKCKHNSDDNSGGGEPRQQQQRVEEFPYFHLQEHDGKGQHEQMLHAYWGNGDGNR